MVLPGRLCACVQRAPASLARPPWSIALEPLASFLSLGRGPGAGRRAARLLPVAQAKAAAARRTRPCESLRSLAAGELLGTPPMRLLARAAPGQINIGRSRLGRAAGGKWRNRADDLNEITEFQLDGGGGGGVDEEGRESKKMAIMSGATCCPTPDRFLVAPKLSNGDTCSCPAGRQVAKARAASRANKLRQARMETGCARQKAE